MYKKLEVIYKNGQPYGIRDEGGYLLFFPKVDKYQGQEQRYKEEIKECFDLAEKIINALK
jgi:diadenosine tetraphosphate (Ap4A) HIT family hydrolase